MARVFQLKKFLRHIDDQLLKALAPEVRVLNCIFEPVSPYDNYHKNNENYFFSGSFSSGGDRCGIYRPEVKNEHEENWVHCLINLI